MSVSEDAAAALRELHSRLKSLEDKVQGSVESGTGGVLTKLAHRTTCQLKCSSEWWTRHTTLKYCLFERIATILRFLVVNMKSTKTGSTKLESSWTLSSFVLKKSHTLEDLRPIDWYGRRSGLHNVTKLSWLDRRCNLDEPATLQCLGSEDQRKPFQTVKNCYGAGPWVKLLRAHKGKSASRRQRLTERIHDVKRVSSYSEVLARMEMWEAASKKHFKDIGCEVADINRANCLKRLVSTDPFADLQKMSHIVRYNWRKEVHHRPS